MSTTLGQLHHKRTPKGPTYKELAAELHAQVAIRRRLAVAQRQLVHLQ